MNFILLHSHSSALSFDFFDAFTEIILHGMLDTLKIIPFLFLTYLLMEYLEHRQNDKIRKAIKGAEKTGPIIGAALGIVPQCGFSGAASGFFSARIISVGTLIAIFLSTSDEMLPILIAGEIAPSTVIIILLYKLLVGIFVGFLVDFLLKIFKGQIEHRGHIHDMCKEEGCHCERGILISSLYHTLKIGGFLLLVTVLINALVYFVGTDVLENSVFSLPFVSHLIAALIGLIPNCAVSVALSDFYLYGFISCGTMLSGLFSGAGVGLVVLFKTNKNIRQNLLISLILVLSGLVFGMLFDILPLGI